MPAPTKSTAMPALQNQTEPLLVIFMSSLLLDRRAVARRVPNYEPLGSPFELTGPPTRTTDSTYVRARRRAAARARLSLECPRRARVRLHHRRRGDRRVRARESPVGRSRYERVAARGRRQGRLLLDRRARRLPLHD